MDKHNHEKQMLLENETNDHNHDLGIFRSQNCTSVKFQNDKKKHHTV